MNRKFQLVALVVFIGSLQARGQYFGRNSVQLPAIGWMALDSSLGGLNESLLGVNDQIQIGTGYARDLFALRLWWLTETAVGFAQVDQPDARKSQVAVTLNVSTGIKYNFWGEYWRPFAGLMVEMFQIFNYHHSVPYEDYSSLMWAAVRPMAGVEWIFSPDMSLELQAGYMLLHNFEDPLRHSIMSRISYRTYF